MGQMRSEGDAQVRPEAFAAASLPDGEGPGDRVPQETSGTFGVRI